MATVRSQRINPYLVVVGHAPRYMAGRLSVKTFWARSSAECQGAPGARLSTASQTGMRTGRAAT